MSVYLICDKCGLDWNVSKTRKPGRVYICPVCERKLRGWKRDR